MTWLQGEDSAASPQLQVLISEYALARLFNPAGHPAAVNRAARKIRRICAGV